MTWDSGTGATAAIDFSKVNSPKTPLNFTRVICNRGWPDNDNKQLVVILDDNGNLADSINGPTQIAFPLTDILWGESTGLSDGSCTESRTKALARASKTGRLSVLCFSGQAAPGSTEIDAERATLTKAYTIIPPAAAVEEGGQSVPSLPPSDSTGGEGVVKHTITIHYVDVLGLGDLLAQNLLTPFVLDKIRALLPSNFRLEDVQIDREFNEIRVLMHEDGNNALILAVVIGIVAIFASRLLIKGWKYDELKDFNKEVVAANNYNVDTIDQLKELLEDTSKTDEQKVSEARKLLGERGTKDTPEEPDGLPDTDGGPFDEVKEVAGLFLIGVLGIAALGAFKK